MCKACLRILSLSLSFVCVLVFADPAPQQSITGPLPPAEVAPPAEGDSLLDGDVVLTVPCYHWRHGCGPTAVGMVLGYYDMLGYADLFDGDATTQTTAVNQGIASQRDSLNPGHYEDYSQPIDDGEPDPLPDKSEAPYGDEHAHDCIADFMETSWSSRDNFYGWSWSSDIGPAFRDYVNFRNPAYSPSTDSYYMGSSLTWSVLTGEINAGRPMVFLVDTDADGWTDHFVTVVGYRSSPQQYGCLDTWFTPIRWCNFVKIGSGVSWGIWGGWSFDLASLPSPDIDGDGKVNYGDFAFLAEQWMDVPGSPSADLALDGYVDEEDLLVLAMHWLE